MSIHARRLIRASIVIALALGALAALFAASDIRTADAGVYYGCGPLRTSGSSMTSGAGGLMLGADLDELTDGSSRVASGTVRSLQTCRSTGAVTIVTFVTLDVELALKVEDDHPASTLRIAVPGGAIDGLTLAVGTSPEFAADERVVVFLGRDSRGDDVPSFGFQGKFSVSAGGVVERANLALDEFAAAVESAAAGDLGSEDPLRNGPQIIESAYQLNGPKFIDADIPMQVNINPNSSLPAQLTAQETRLAVINAYQAWQDLPDSYIAFGPFTNTTRTSQQGDCDGKHDVTWGISMSHSSGVLAVTYTCYSGTKILDGDIEVDTDHFGSKWRVDGSGACGSGTYDLQTVVLHEAGHFFGLGHPSNNSCQPCPVMDASYGGVNRTPCADDENGTDALYPLAGGSAPAAPGGFGVTSALQIGLNWSNVSSEMGYEIWRADGLCAGATFELLDTVKADVLTYTDSYYGGGLIPGAPYCYKLRSFNTNGTSAFSAAAQGYAGVAPTPSPSPTASPTATASPSPTATPTPSPTASPSPTPTPSSTQTPSPTPSPTLTPTPTPSPSPTASPTSSPPTPSPTPTASPTPSPSPTTAPTISPPPAPTASPPPAQPSGDVDCDNLLTVHDSMSILGAAAGVAADDGCLANGDVNCSGDVDTKDALIVLMVVSGLADLQGACS